MDDLHCKHEAYWYMRSRVSEVRDGDKNTSYFHHKASHRRSRNRMKGLFDSDGVWHENDDKMQEIVKKYYHDLFTSTEPTPEKMQEVLKHMECVISPEVNATLSRPYTKTENFEALQQMHPSKAPKPDGMRAIFF